MKETKIVSINIDKNVKSSAVWNFIKRKDYAQELGSVFDKNAFVESDWKLGLKFISNMNLKKCIYGNNNQTNCWLSKVKELSEKYEV